MVHCCDIIIITLSFKLMLFLLQAKTVGLNTFKQMCLNRPEYLSRMSNDKSSPRLRQASTEQLFTSSWVYSE